MNPLKLGCIADDFTGATDLANTLVRNWMRVVQTIGTPTDAAAIDADAIVVALKSRTIAPAAAVTESLAACRWLRAQGAQRIYFKICSTFDSTPRGNIGPVLEALMDELDCGFALVTPALPDNGRTVYCGHLFVGDKLLSDSTMRDHPLTPMTDGNLVRVLQAQLDVQHGRKVGLIAHAQVAAGPQAIAAAVQALQAQACALAIADALSNPDLLALGAALQDQVLLCGGSGLAGGLAAHWGMAPPRHGAVSIGMAQASAPLAIAADALPAPTGQRAIVAGSCSAATLAQVAHFVRTGGAAHALDPLRLRNPESRDACVTELVQWCRAQWQQRSEQPVLIHSSATAETVRAVQQTLGVTEAGTLVEQTLGHIAQALVAHGARQLIVAGGETAGACVQALNIQQLRIGPQIDPGVPWCHAQAPLAAPHGLHITLKSGNFGTDDFFTKAFARLQAGNGGP